MPERPVELVTCPRCAIALSDVGTKRFHEGSRALEAMGGVWELFKNREHYDVYVCDRCGRVEFFVDTIGEELRNEPDLDPRSSPPDEDVPPPEDASSTESIQCLQCGATIDAGRSTCPACGWSYLG